MIEQRDARRPPFARRSRCRERRAEARRHRPVAWEATARRSEADEDAARPGGADPPSPRRRHRTGRCASRRSAARCAALPRVSSEIAGERANVCAAAAGDPRGRDRCPVVARSAHSMHAHARRLQLERQRRAARRRTRACPRPSSPNTPAAPDRSRRSAAQCPRRSPHRSAAPRSRVTSPVPSSVSVSAPNRIVASYTFGSPSM